METLLTLSMFLWVPEFVGFSIRPQQGIGCGGPDGAELVADGARTRAAPENFGSSSFSYARGGVSRAAIWGAGHESEHQLAFRPFRLIARVPNLPLYMVSRRITSSRAIVFGRI